ncbi:hypothetical protein Salat_2671300 [Sesamum alatum]|uniref:Uncharacterized protein n=1 Tax=Sesamum alatum TaxID=300844 RepID=A0AAE2CB13_9LAMI|nr:hypothetical protein Salat_2671300 [Sesamum alatum]
MSLSLSPPRVLVNGGGNNGDPEEAAEDGQDGEGAAGSKFDLPAFESLTEWVMGNDESMSVLNRLKLRWREKYGYTSGRSAYATMGALTEVTSSTLHTTGCGLESLTSCSARHGLNPTPRVLQGATEAGSTSAER